MILNIIFTKKKNNEEFQRLTLGNYNKPCYSRFLLEPGTIYKYKVQISSELYGDSLESSIVSITTTSDQPLIDNFRVSSNYITNTLEWDVKKSVSGINNLNSIQTVYYYDIYRHSSDDSFPIKVITQALFKITGILRFGNILTCNFTPIINMNTLNSESEFNLEFEYEYVWQFASENVDSQFTSSTSDNNSGITESEFIITHTIKQENVHKWVRVKIIKKDKLNVFPEETYYSIPAGIIVGENEEINENTTNLQNINTGPDVDNVFYYDNDVKLDTMYTYYVYPKNILANRNSFGRIFWASSTYMFNGIPVNLKLEYLKDINSIKLSWNNLSLPMNIENPEIKYTITYKIKSKIDDEQEIESEEIQEKEKIISSIKINGNYLFSVKAIFKLNDEVNTISSEYSIPVNYNNNFDTITNITVNYNEETDEIKIKWTEPLIPFKPDKYKIKFVESENENIDIIFPEGENYIYGNHFETDGYIISPGDYEVKIFPYYTFNDSDISGVSQNSTLTVPLHSIKYLNYIENNGIVTLFWNKLLGENLRYRVKKTPVNNGNECDCPTNSWTIFVCQSSYNENQGWTDTTPIIKPNTYSYDVSVEYFEDEDIVCGPNETENPVLCNSVG